MMESKIRIPPPAHPPMAAAAESDPLLLERSPLLEDGVGIEVSLTESDDEPAVEVVRDVGIISLGDVDTMMEDDGGSVSDEGGSASADVVDAEAMVEDED